MLTIATGKEVALLLFHTATKYGSDRFRRIFKKLTDLSISRPLGALVGLSPGRDSGRTGQPAQFGTARAVRYPTERTHPSRFEEPEQFDRTPAAKQPRSMVLADGRGA